MLTSALVAKQSLEQTGFAIKKVGFVAIVSLTS
jgi:hypothetical protein